MQYRQLGNTGMKVSILGFGAAPLSGAYGDFEKADAMRAVRTAFDHGVNIFDVSPYYGPYRAERLLGEALEGIPRERYFLSTKLGRYGLNDFNFSAERVRRSIDESLARLRVEYVDILLCHDIEFVSLDQIVEETLPAVREIQAQGKARFVGVSGLPLKIFSYVLDRAGLDVILSYCHYCLNDNSLASIVPYLQSKQVGILNAAPTGMGLCTESGPPSWHPASAEIKGACARAAAFCHERGVNIVQLAIQYALANPNLATTFVGSPRSAEVESNVRWTEEPLDQELLTDVQKILSPIHNQTWRSGRAENN